MLGLVDGLEAQEIMICCVIVQKRKKFLKLLILLVSDVRVIAWKMYRDEPFMPAAVFAFEPILETYRAPVSFLGLIPVQLRTCAYLLPCLVATLASGRAFWGFTCFSCGFWAHGGCIYVCPPTRLRLSSTLTCSIYAKEVFAQRKNSWNAMNVENL